MLGNKYYNQFIVAIYNWSQYITRLQFSLTAEIAWNNKKNAIYLGVCRD